VQESLEHRQRSNSWSFRKQFRSTEVALLGSAAAAPALNCLPSVGWGDCMTRETERSEGRCSARPGSLPLAD
jgi:hypothetical protein